MNNWQSVFWFCFCGHSVYNLPLFPPSPKKITKRLLLVRLHKGFVGGDGEMGVARKQLTNLRQESGEREREGEREKNEEMRKGAYLLLFLLTLGRDGMGG